MKGRVHMAIDDLGKKASDLVGKAKSAVEQNADKIQDALKSEQAEEVSDKALDGLANLANKVTGGKHSAKVEEVRNKLDGSIGNE